MQQHSLDNNILHSGLVIDYQDNLNLSQLKQAVYKLIQAESLLRSTLIKEEQTIYIKEYENLKEYYLPIIDLSKEDEGVKKEMNSLLEHRVYGNETWNKDDIFEKLLYQIIVAKYGDMDWKIYIPCCHFIFDGMSAGIIKNKLLRYYNNPNKKVEIKNSFYEYAQRLIYGPINIDSNTCVNKFELGRFNQNISKQNKIKPLELVNTTVRLSLENTIKQLEPRYAWNISYKIFMRLLYHTFGLEEISAAILVADRKSSTSSFFDTIGEFLDLLPISDFKEPEKDYKDIEILLDIMAKKHISFVEFVYNKENEGKYGDIKKIFGKIKGEKLQLPIFNYVGLYDEVKYEQFKTYEQKEFTTIVDVVCYKNELVIKGFCLKGEEEILCQKLQHDLSENMLNNI